MSSLELAKEHYFHELQRKQEIESAMNLPITVLTIITGAIAFLARDAYLPPGPLTYIFVALLTTAGIGIAVGFALTLAAFWRYFYSEIPIADLLVYRESLERYHRSVGTPTLADAEFSEGLLRRYTQALARNAAVNQRRAWALYYAKFYLSLAAIALLLSAAPFGILKANEPPEPKETSDVRVGCSSYPSFGEPGASDRGAERPGRRGAGAGP